MSDDNMAHSESSHGSDRVIYKQKDRLGIHRQIVGTADCKSLATSKLKQWKTTIDLPHMNMIIFPASACPTSLFKHNKSIVVFHCFSLLVARLLQSAVI